MAKRIIEMVRAKRDAMAGDHAAAEELGKLAAAAVNGGINSQAWKRFMLEFVEKDPDDPTKPLDPAQLAQLLGQNERATDEALMRKRGYLLGNAMCGAGSPDTGNLEFFVDSIDEGLISGCKTEANKGTSAGTDESYETDESAASATQSAG